jgi:hypothetical protein
MTILSALCAAAFVWGHIPFAHDPVVEKPPLGLDPFYRKHVSQEGLPIVSSAKVSDRALAEAHRIVKEMLRNLPDARAALIRNKVRVAIMAHDEQTLDIPEHRDLQEKFPQTDWNKRARGLGATKERPATSAGEENLLGLAGDRYKGESILIHEFAHTVFDMGIAEARKDAAKRLKDCYDRAMAEGLWKQTYAATNPSEYWAEGVQSYFDANRTASPPNGVHNHVGTREALIQYDPGLYRLIDEFFRTSWRWKGPPGLIGSCPSAAPRRPF